MYKIIFLSCILSIIALPRLNAQEYNLSTADSVTYCMFQKGDWDNLIKTGKELIHQNIDFKTLRQRMGYAYFIKKNYMLSRWYYAKALDFDKYDEISNLYLYYTGLYTGDENFKRFYAQKLTKDFKSKYKIKAIRAIDAVDVEYNYKTGYSLNNSDMNIYSSAKYMRFGVNSELGYKFSLYQTISKFDQTFLDTYKINQNCYYGLLTWNPTAYLTLNTGYHYLKSSVNSTDYNSNMFFGKITYKKFLFDASLMSSTFKNSTGRYNQIGVHLGVNLPEMLNLYLQGTIYHLNDSVSGNWIYNLSIGFAPLKRCWLEFYGTEGKQLNFVELNGVYVYNSFDYSTFKTGATIYWYATNNLTLFTNYSYDTKYINIAYYGINESHTQHSISGGIIWKL